MSADILTIADSEGVRTITLNRANKLNALNIELTTAVRDALLDCDKDESVRAVVLAGAGRGFCAGADLKEFSDLTPEHAERVVERASLTAELQSLPTRLRVPVVAAVKGAAVGGGAGLALACDMMVVADDVSFGYPEIRHDIVPALVMTGLQRHVGRKLGFELISTGRMLGASELFELGLANQVVDSGDELARAQEIAARWAGRSQEALSAIKSLYYRVADLPTPAAMQAGQDLNALMRSFRS
ncbi:enoyl-CoA hydratase/isomerase family protein [Brevibacterium aurantiacum]|uniref:enoyl-CoA hydratase/isomerase family protein n=1 Tax=Brevibacterium aurantiacum TaxID=273384 RepID=UPI0000510141|nr:enoyl-CoA hydratase/isomerase family protein [Brevibacterium aurantiacum]